MAENRFEFDFEGGNEIDQELLGKKDYDPCKKWFAKVFVYCTIADFKHDLNRFLRHINEEASKEGKCFQVEETVYLGCTCACGFNQIIVYYSFRKIEIGRW